MENNCFCNYYSFGSLRSNYLYNNFVKKENARGGIRLRPAHEIALAQLERLKMQYQIRSGKIKEYYVQISGIIRHYLENRFKLRAPEMTTEEFLIHVRDYSQFADGHKALLKEFLFGLRSASIHKVFTCRTGDQRGICYCEEFYLKQKNRKRRTRNNIAIARFF